MIFEKKERCLKRYDDLLPNQADYIARHARGNAGGLALIEHNTGERVTWKSFNTSVSAFAAKLLAMGLKKGDVVATSLPMLKEHAYLIYACYRTGIIIAPLDLRLKAGEINYCLEKIRPRAYFFLGKTPVADFRPMIEAVMDACPFVEHWIQFQKEADLVMDRAVGINEFARDIKKIYLLSLVTGSVRRARRAVGKRDPCLIIFTTGSTGSPKPGLLCHENISIQNIGLAVSFNMDKSDTMLVNLPPSHVGCITEQLATTIFGGGTSVLLHVFDARLSLEAIEAHRVTVLGQIPALFNMEWRLDDYDRFDLSSLRFAIYGGQAVPADFLERMQRMAPTVGSGLGLTETAGFCTYTDIDADLATIAAGLGTDSPLCPMTIRHPMGGDGTAGATLPPGEIGEICFSGPQVFLGYLNDPENTAKTVSTDGVLYTGDLGFVDEAGLHFAGRSKLMIKPKGYNVYPEDVEKHITGKFPGQIAMAACVGAEHRVFSEAVMVFVEKTADDAPVSAEAVKAACQDIAAYSRPSHVEVVAPGELPLNRVAKIDYMALKAEAEKVVSRLRARGGWDG